jgi:hypothetical protein
MSKVHGFVVMWQGSQNLHATQRESPTENKQITAVGYISDTELIVTAFRTNVEHDGAAAFILPERSPQPPAFSAKDLLRGRTQNMNVCQIKKIDRHSVEMNMNCALESISVTENWLDWNGDLDNPNVR